MLKGRGDQNMSRYHLKNTIGKDIVLAEGDKEPLEKYIFHASASPIGRLCWDAWHWF